MSGLVRFFDLLSFRVGGLRGSSPCNVRLGERKVRLPRRTGTYHMSTVVKMAATGLYNIDIYNDMIKLTHAAARHTYITLTSFETEPLRL